MKSPLNSLQTQIASHYVENKDGQYDSASPQHLRDIVQANDLTEFEFAAGLPKTDWSAVVNEQGQNPLHLAIELGHVEMAIRIVGRLSSGDVALDAKDKKGNTPLILAIEKGNTEVANALIDMNAGIYDGDRSHEMPDSKPPLTDHEKLLIETLGDTIEALRLARERNIPGFEMRLATPEQSAKLLSLCERGRIEEAREFIAQGVDASLVLMRGTLQYDPVKAVAHGQALRNLIAAGADVCVALKYAIAAKEMLAAHRAACYLGADGEAELESRVQSRDEPGVKLLFDAGVGREEVLARQAIKGDAEGVKLMLSGGTNAMRVLMKLARANETSAIALLVKAGANTDLALSQLLKHGQLQAAKLIINAGANTEKLMAMLTSQNGLHMHGGITRLSELIALGADPSKPLYNAAERKDYALAKLLLLAGANIDDACKHAIDNVVGIRHKLRSLSMEVSKLKTVVKAKDENGQEDITVMEKILSAKNYLESPRGQRFITGMRAYIKDLNGNTDAQAKVAAKLFRAVVDLDWPAIKKWSQVKMAADEALQAAAVNYQVHMARLVAAAGASRASCDETAEMAISQGDPQIVLTLSTAGWPLHELLAIAIDRKRLDVAKLTVAEGDPDMLFLLKDAWTQKGDEVLKKFIPALTDGRDELVRAIREGYDDLAKKLVAAGVNPSDALTWSRVESAPPRVHKALIDLGAHESFAIAHAIENGYPTMEQSWIAAGGSPRMALIYAEKNGLTKAVTTLMKAGVMLDPGFETV